jgi:hypothetical protein
MKRNKRENEVKTGSTPYFQAYAKKQYVTDDVHASACPDGRAVFQLFRDAADAIIENREW